MSKHTRRNVVLLAVCGAAVLGAALLVVQRLGLGGVVRERYTLGPIPKATYIGSEACGRCHEDAYADWQRSGHSRQEPQYRGA